MDADHPALLEALEAADDVVPLFVIDPALLGPSGAPRLAQLLGCLEALRNAIGGALVLRSGDPVVEVPRLAAEVGADHVFVTEDFGPYGRVRDERVAAALDGDGRSTRDPKPRGRGAQGKRFDPEGDYVRRWVRELAGIPGAAVHEPWALGGGQGGLFSEYPPPLVDHASERAEALARYGALRS